MYKDSVFLLDSIFASIEMLTKVSLCSQSNPKYVLFSFMPLKLAATAKLYALLVDFASHTHIIWYQQTDTIHSDQTYY